MTINQRNNGKVSIIPYEAEEQKQFINYCTAKGITVISTQNGIYAGNSTGRFGYFKKLKELGLSKGVPDLIILARNSSHEVLFLEMKRQNGGKLSEEQKEWISFLDESEYCVGVAKGCESAIKILDKYLRS